MNKIKAIPEGYHTITPYLIVKGADKALDFYKKALGAQENMRFTTDDNHVAHAEMQIGDSRFMLGEECDEMKAYGPQHFGGSSMGIYLYVDDVDAFVKKAVANGAKLTMEVKDQFWGDRSGSLEDPFGHQWYVASHVEDVSPEEMKQRMKSAGK